MDTTPSSNRPRGRVVFHSAREYRVLSGAVALCIGLLLLDQATKLLVERYFTLGRSLEIIPGFFSLTYVTNRGAAWGILTGHGWLLLLIAVVGYFFLKLEIPIAPIVLALILGPLAESNLRRSLLLSQGSASTFFTRPICIFFLLLAVLSLCWPLLRKALSNRKKAA